MCNYKILLLSHFLLYVSIFLCNTENVKAVNMIHRHKLEDNPSNYNYIGNTPKIIVVFSSVQVKLWKMISCDKVKTSEISLLLQPITRS